VIKAVIITAKTFALDATALPLDSISETLVSLPLAVAFGDVVLVLKLVILAAPLGIEVCSPKLTTAVDTAPGGELVAVATAMAETGYVVGAYMFVIVDP
jgi:hypothetical protein